LEIFKVLMEKQIKVSVWITAYNHEKYIAEAIEGAINQITKFKFEIVIGEDYSFDKTREICLNFQKKYPEKIKLILNENNKGLIANYCDTLEQCSGKYIAQCDGDDYWIDPYKLQKQVDFLESNDDCAMVFTDKYAQQNETIFKEKIKIFSDISFKSILLSNMICSPTVLIRKDIINRYYNENAQIALDRKWLTLDYPLWLEVSYNYKIGYIPEITSIYRVVSGSGSHGKDKLRSYQWDKCILDMQLFYYKKYFISNQQSNVSFKYKFNEMLYHTRKRMLLDYGLIAKEQLKNLVFANPLFLIYIVNQKVKRTIFNNK